MVTDGAVPLSAPPAVRLSHPGSPVALNEVDPVPPVVLKVCE